MALFAVASSSACRGEDGSVSTFVADTVTPTGFWVNGIPADLSGTFLDLEAGTYFVEVGHVAIGKHLLGYGHRGRR